MWLRHYHSLINSIPDSPVHIHNAAIHCSTINNNIVVKVEELQ